MFKFKLHIICFFLGLTSVVSQAQSYGTALGLRFGNNKVSRTVGLSLQQRVLNKVTIEGIVQTDFRNNSLFHANIQHHRSFLTKRFNIYGGAGFSAGTEQSEMKRGDSIVITNGNHTLGADLVIGVEATLLRYNLSLDYKPNFNLVGREPWYRGQFAVSARYVIVKASTLKKRQKQREKKRRKKQKEKDKNKKERAKEKDKKDSDDQKPLFQGIYNKLFPGKDQ